MNELRPFAPLYQPTQNTAPGPGLQATQTQQGQFLPGVIVAASNGASVNSTALPGTAGNNSPTQFYVANKTSVWVHVNFGVLGAVRAAALTDPGMPPGTVNVFSVAPECNAAAIFADGAPAASTSVVFHRGAGT